MTDEIYADPIGRKFRVIRGSELNNMFSNISGIIHDDDAKFYIPFNKPDDKREFPSAPTFNDLHFVTSSGKVVHEVNRHDSYGPQAPPKIYETAEGIRVLGGEGFTAADLVIFSEYDWFAECWDVMKAHGWEYKGDISQHIVDYVSKEYGPCEITRAKVKYGDSWQNRVAELAAIQLVQPLSRLWYAVNMIALYYCYHDDLRLGYLWAEYRMRMALEKDAIRGETVVKSAKSGGLSRAAAKKASSQPVIEAMEARVGAGQSISNAARLTFKDGLGASPEANRKLWARHCRK